MSEPNENNVDPDQSEMVVVGRRDSLVPFQLVQDVYNELTGKTEKISKNYNDSIQIDIDNIKDLDKRIRQFYEQYHIKAENCSGTIFYVDNSKDQLSSFERLEMHSVGSSVQVESVLLKYNFVILLPKITRIQNYSITIRIMSRIAVIKKMRENEVFNIPKLGRIFGDRTATIELEYIDYTVARTFMNVFDDWYKVLPKKSNNKIIKFLQKHSNKFVPIARLFTVCISTGALISVISTFVDQNSRNLALFGKFLLFSFLIVYLARAFAAYAAKFVEDAVDSWESLSFIKLNKADEKEVKDTEEANKKSLINGFLGFCATMSVSVVAKVVAGFIVHAIFKPPV